MSDHLTPDETASAVAGLELVPAAREHLERCVACRAEVADLVGLIGTRRNEMIAQEPAWDEQARQIFDRLPAAAAGTVRPRPRWLRPVLAVAAVLVVAVGLGLLRPDRRVDPPREAVAVEEILAEMNELLADDSIPGFEIIDPGTDDLETYVDNGAS
jgi:hypothetical protein